MSEEFAELSMYDSNEGVEIDECDSYEEDINSSEEELIIFYESKEYKDWIGFGRQPIHIATSLGRLDLVAKLLKRGHDIDSTNDNGFTALHYSAQQGNLDVLKFLINQNAAIDQQDNDGETALIMAVHNSHIDVVEYLCKIADINIKANNNKTALDIAIEYNKTQIINILQKYANQS